MLATEPQVLLLDEPMAGMSADETLRMVALIKRLKQGHTLVLIEHDMDAVFARRRRDHGDGQWRRCWPSGAPETIRAEPRGAGCLSRRRTTRGMSALLEA